MTTHTVAQIISEARERLGINQSELARRLSVSAQAVQAWESGRAVPRPAKFEAIARALGIRGHSLLRASGMMDVKTVSEFLTLFGDDEPARSPESPSPTQNREIPVPAAEDQISVPRLREVELSAGPGMFSIEEEPTSNLTFSKRDLIARSVDPSDVRCVTVSGSSMLPVLRDGATVGVDISKSKLSDLVEGEIYAIDHGGQLRLKQVLRLPSGLRLRSFNRDEYPDEDYSFQQLQDERIRILGHVFWWGMFA